MATPIAKLNNEDTNGYGLALEANIMYRRTRPATEKVRNKGREDDSGYLHHEVSSLMFSPKGQIYSVVIPHPPVELWLAYEAKRDKKLNEVMDTGMLTYSKDEAIDIIEQQRRSNGGSKKKRKIE
jgi:hypothetical protein